MLVFIEIYTGSEKKKIDIPFGSITLVVIYHFMGLICVHVTINTFVKVF